MDKNAPRTRTSFLRKRNSSKRRPILFIFVITSLYLILVSFNLNGSSQLLRELNTIDLGGGKCSIDPLADDAKELPSGATRFLLASYPGSGKRFAWTVIKALSNYDVADDWDFSNKMDSNPFLVKTSWPHREGTWSWGDQMDNIILLLRNPRWAIPAYYNMRNELGFSSNWASSYTRMYFTYTERPPLRDWEHFRDNWFHNELEAWADYIDFWMLGGFNKYEGRHSQCALMGGQRLMDCHPKEVVDFDVFYQREPSKEFYKVAALLDSANAEMVAAQARTCVLESVYDDNSLRHNNNRNSIEGQSREDYRFTRRQLESMAHTVRNLRDKYSMWDENPVAQSLVDILDSYASQISAEYKHEYEQMFVANGLLGAAPPRLLTTQKDDEIRRDLLNYKMFMGELYKMVFENELPPGVTQDDLTNFFQNCAIEYNEAPNLKTVPLVTMSGAVDAVVNVATGMKDELIGYQAGAEAAQIVSDLAQAAFLAMSWVPFVNLGLEATALAAAVAATGLEIKADTYQNSVVEYIASMNKKTTLQPGMEPIVAWYNANTANALFFPRLGMEDKLKIVQKDQHTFVQSIAIGIGKFGHKLGLVDGAPVDADGYKAYINATERFYSTADESAVDQLEDAIAAVIEDPGNIAQADVEEVADHIVGQLSIDASSFAPLVIDVWASSAALCLTYRTWSKTGSKAGTKAAREAGVEMAKLISDRFAEAAGEGAGEAVEAGGEAASASMDVISTTEKVIGGIGIAAGFVLVGLDIASTVELNNKLTDAIAKTGNYMHDYYNTIAGA